MARDKWVRKSQGHRDKSRKQDVIQGPTAGLATEEHVLVQCRVCKNHKVDPLPLFRASDGVYVAREQTCPKCKPKSFSKKTGQPSLKKTLHHPVDGRDKISMQKIRKDSAN